MNRRELETAIEREVEQWPDVSLTFADGGKHPKAKLRFADLLMAVTYSSTPSDVFAITNCLGDVRRTLRKLGATRTTPEPSKEEDEAPYRKPNAGREMRPSPIAAEPVTPPAGIAEQLTDVGIAPREPTPVPVLSQAAPQSILPPKDVEYLGPGEYDIDEDRYHADPCETPSLSASIAKVLIDQTPAHAWVKHPRLNPGFERKEKTAYDMGSAFHKLMLGKGATIVPLPYDDWTKAGKVGKAERDSIRESGDIPILQKHYDAAVAMVEAARWQMKGMDDLAYAMAGGTPERVLIWEEQTPAGPIMCRSMMDWIPHVGTLGVDWKSTAVSAGPDGWGGRTMWDIGADVQDAFYRRGLRKVLGREIQALLFAVIENTAPYALAVHACVPAARAVADRKVQYAINVWGMCMHHNRWPAWGNQTFWQSPPPWHESKWIEREDNGSVDLEALESHMARLASMQDIAPTEGAEVTETNPFGLAPIQED